MEIQVTYGRGEGSTELAAFDKALYDAGIANYNLIKLSSVIPGNSRVTIKKIDWNQKDLGYKLYIVLSKCIETIRGKYACAGLGWIQEKTGTGLFVEHCGSSEQEVKKQIELSLDSMQKYRSGEYGKINIKTIGINCRGKPVCSVVCAVFKSKSWQ